MIPFSRDDVQFVFISLVFKVQKCNALINIELVYIGGGARIQLIIVLSAKHLLGNNCTQLLKVIVRAGKMDFKMNPWVNGNLFALRMLMNI